MTPQRPTRAACGLLVAVALVAGCAPAATEAASRVAPAGRPASSAAGRSAATDAPALRATSVQRLARQVTVRVRARGCGRLGTASAVAVAPRLLVTNRHVVDGARAISINFWDGTSARARLRSLAVADDLALVRVSLRLPAVARLADGDVEEDARVLVAGYPDGGRQAVESGRVIEYARLREPMAASPVMRLSASIAPGNSGGAVIDRSGHLVGVIFGVETETGYGLAIPASAVRDLLTRGGTPAAAGCR